MKYSTVLASLGLGALLSATVMPSAYAAQGTDIPQTPLVNINFTSNSDMYIDATYESAPHDGETWTFVIHTTGQPDIVLSDSDYDLMGFHTVIRANDLPTSGFDYSIDAIYGGETISGIYGGHVGDVNTVDSDQNSPAAVSDQGDTSAATGSAHYVGSSYSGTSCEDNTGGFTYTINHDMSDPAPYRDLQVKYLGDGSGSDAETYYRADGSTGDAGEILTFAQIERGSTLTYSLDNLPPGDYRIVTDGSRAIKNLYKWDFTIEDLGCATPDEPVALTPNTVDDDMSTNTPTATPARVDQEVPSPVKTTDPVETIRNNVPTITPQGVPTATTLTDVTGNTDTDVIIDEGAPRALTPVLEGTLVPVEETPTLSIYTYNVPTQLKQAVPGLIGELVEVHESATTYVDGSHGTISTVPVGDLSLVTFIVDEIEELTPWHAFFPQLTPSVVQSLVSTETHEVSQGIGTPNSIAHHAVLTHTVTPTDVAISESDGDGTAMVTDGSSEATSPLINSDPTTTLSYDDEDWFIATDGSLSHTGAEDFILPLTIAGGLLLAGGLFVGYSRRQGAR